MIRFHFSIQPRDAQPSSVVNTRVFGYMSAVTTWCRRDLPLPSRWDKCPKSGQTWAKPHTPSAAAFRKLGSPPADAADDHRDSSTRHPQEREVGHSSPPGLRTGQEWPQTPTKQWEERVMTLRLLLEEICIIFIPKVLVKAEINCLTKSPLLGPNKWLKTMFSRCV